MTSATGNPSIDARAAPGQAGAAVDQVAVRLEHVSTSFGDQKVLQDVTFEVGRATAFCLLG